MAADKNIVVNIEYVFAHALKPFPTKIGQAEKQLVIYKANTYFFSPYKVNNQKTTVKLSTSTIESYSKLKPSSSADNTITYGPYKDIKPYSVHEMKIHFENNSPFLTVKDMTRWIEVSHWGNVAVEETYHLVHEGAQLKVFFSLCYVLTGLNSKVYLYIFFFTYDNNIFIHRVIFPAMITKELQRMQL